MSVKAMAWVWDHSEAHASDRLVLLAIADHAGHDGSNAWPAVETIVQKTRLSESTVHRAISRLIDMGELEVVRRPGLTNLFSLPMTPPSDTPVMVTPQGYQGDTPPPPTVTPEPSMNHQEPSIGAHSAPRKRGSRIPEVFHISDEMFDWAAENAKLVDVHVETQKFVNYWKAKPGREALKLDWKRTWQNWLLKAQQDEARRERPRTASTMSSRASPRR